MPVYDILMLLKTHPRQGAVLATKDVARAFLQRGSILKRIDNMGLKELGHRITFNNRSYTLGHFVDMRVVCNPQTLIEVQKEVISKNDNIIRTNVRKLLGHPGLVEMDRVIPTPFTKHLKNLEYLPKTTVEFKNKSS